MRRFPRYLASFFMCLLITLPTITYAQESKLSDATCAVISGFISKVDETCKKFFDDARARGKKMELLQLDWQKELTSVMDSGDRYMDVFMAGTNYRTWSNKIVWGLHSEHWRNQTDIMNSWETKKQEALNKLKSYCN